MLAFDMVQRLTGPSGEWLPDATSESADPMAYSGYRYAVVDGAPFTNWAKKAELDAIDAYKKTEGADANLNGLYWPVRRVDY